MADDFFIELLAAVDAVHQLQFAGWPRGLEPLLDPADVGNRFLAKAKPCQGIDGKGRIANPAIAVIPVTAAADRLRQSKGRSGNQRAIFVASQQFKNER